MLKAPKIENEERKSSIITQSDAQQIARRIKKLTDIDIFHKTRKQEYVYVRSVFNHTLSKVFSWGLSRIAQLYNQNGYKNYDHATACRLVYYLQHILFYNTAALHSLPD